MVKQVDVLKASADKHSRLLSRGFFSKARQREVNGSGTKWLLRLPKCQVEEFGAHSYHTICVSQGRPLFIELCYMTRLHFTNRAEHPGKTVTSVGVFGCYMYVCIHVCTYLCKGMREYMYTYAYTCMYVQMRVYVYVYVCISMCTYTYVCMRVSIVYRYTRALPVRPKQAHGPGCC